MDVVALHHHSDYGQSCLQHQESSSWEDYPRQDLHRQKEDMIKIEKNKMANQLTTKLEHSLRNLRYLAEQK